MAFSRVKVSGWAYGEILTSSQMNTLDIDHANALDAVNGGTYDIGTNTLSISATSGIIEFLTNVNFETILVNSNIIGNFLTLTGTANLKGNVNLGDATSDAVALKGILTPTSSGRIRETAILLNAPGTTVDVTEFQNITFVAGTSAGTTTLSGSVGDDDWFQIHNGSANIQTTNGLVSAVLQPNQGRKYVRVGGVWSAMSSWLD